MEGRRTSSRITWVLGIHTTRTSNFTFRIGPCRPSSTATREPHSQRLYFQKGGGGDNSAKLDQLLPRKVVFLSDCAHPHPPLPLGADQGVDDKKFSLATHSGWDRQGLDRGLAPEMDLRRVVGIPALRRIQQAGSLASAATASLPWQCNNLIKPRDAAGRESHPPSQRW